jgi:hypothetical protein
MKGIMAAVMAMQLAVPATDGFITAKKVLPTTAYTRHPENALGMADGQFAEIRYPGSLDLELEERIMSQKLVVISRAIAEEPELAARTYELWARANKNETWAGNENGEPKTTIFNCSALESAKYVRIAYKDLATPTQENDAIGIDSIDSKF